MNWNNGDTVRHIKAFEADKSMSLEKRQQVLSDLVALVMNRCVDAQEGEGYCAKRLPFANKGYAQGWIDVVIFGGDKPQRGGADKLAIGITRSEWDNVPAGDTVEKYLDSTHYLIYETPNNERQIRRTECRMKPVSATPSMGPTRLHRHELSLGKPELAQRLGTVDYEEVVILQNVLDPKNNIIVDPASRKK